ncbi:MULTISPECIES: hypothetical protein [Aphanothece]|uniref:hypothetical protein n=1 Tax=Aphanothece TaxID=1121 RepID=UPI003985274D
MDNSRDVPLVNNSYGLEGYGDVLAHVDASRIVAYKAHSADEVRCLFVEHLVDPRGILLLTRNPLYCIASHVLGKLDKARSRTGLPQDADELALLCEKAIDLQYEKWFELLGLYYRTKAQGRNCDHVLYEDMCSSQEVDRASFLAKLDRILGRQIKASRMTELVRDWDNIVMASASGEGRAWRGAMTFLHDKNFNLTKFDSIYSLSGLITRLVVKIDKSLDEVVGHSRKFPAYAALQSVLARYRDEIVSFDVTSFGN